MDLGFETRNSCLVRQDAITGGGLGDKNSPSPTDFVGRLPLKGGVVLFLGSWWERLSDNSPLWGESNGAADWWGTC